MDHSISWIFIAVCYAVTALVAEHYIPWRRWIGRPLPKIGAYVLGTLAMDIPFAVLLLQWHGWGRELAALAAIVGASGLAVLILHLTDGKHAAEERADIGEKSVKVFRDGAEESE